MLGFCNESSPLLSAAIRVIQLIGGVGRVGSSTPFEKKSVGPKRNEADRAGTAVAMPHWRFLIENIFPSIECGRFAVKRIAGEPVEVWADIFREGHDVIAASLMWRGAGDAAWTREPMRHDANDRWCGRFIPPRPGRYEYAIEAWSDLFGTWRRDYAAKAEAGTASDLDAREGAELLAAASVPPPHDRAVIDAALAQFRDTANPERMLADDVAAIMAAWPSREDATRSRILPLQADRPIARAGAWYEIFPRSQGTVPGRHGTLDDCIARVPDIAALGFDVLYLTPIHPIGRINRKGRNNALVAAPGDPGSPYAIGSEEGGHDAVHPALGTLADFRRLVEACRRHHMEIALDFAIQCAPDHPWVTQHPEWFRHRADGSIRYAENPPKKYEDIVNPDFFAADAPALWHALRDVVLFWVGEGVRIFRVDNPHTKPFAFWEWMIGEVQRAHPDVIFLAEAFTRPKVMKGLAKLGFSQSYTYFTWRTHKAEMQDYLSELTGYPEREYYRPNFFVNTPDILPVHLQGGERAVFEARVALAATLAASYGIYSGYELIEHEPLPGREEYRDSEKYEIKVRDWNRPGGIAPYIRRLNRIRRENPALLQTSNLRFAQLDNDAVIGFVKESVDAENAVAVAIMLAPAGAGPCEFWFHFGDITIGPPQARRPVAAIDDLVTGERHLIEWGGVRLRIDPGADPALIFRCIPEGAAQ
jgi:starch synthase (maltosyl-transferring)